MTEEIPETIIWTIKRSRRMLLEAFLKWLETNKKAIGEEWYDSLTSTRHSGSDWRDCDTIPGIMGTAMWMFNMVANLGVLAGMGTGNCQIHQLADGLDEETTKRLLMAISTSLNLQYIPRDLVKDFKLPIITSKKFSLKAYVQENPYFFFGVQIMSEESEELRELVRRTRVNKYSQSDPVGLLMRMIEEIRMKTHHHNYRCWEMMVEYIAKWLVLNKKTGLASHSPLRGFQGLDLKKDAVYEHLERQDLFQHYYVAAKASPWDHIGEVWCEKLELVREGQNPTPRAIVEMMTTMTYTGWNPEAELLCWESYRQYVTDYWLEHYSPPRHIEPLRFPLKTQLDTR